MSDSSFDLIATCAFGLEAVVQRELAALGFDPKIGESGRVHFQGGFEAICKANLWLRTADRVLVRVIEFPAADFDALFETIRGIPWGSILPVDASFPVTGRSIKSTLTSVPAVQRSTKRAIVDALQRDHGTQELAETGAPYKIDIALLKDTATLTIDTTGRSLHRRGYRTDISQAPLKETLAAAMVLLSFWRAEKPLIDPFCGSGTIPIEAARIGRNMAPGLLRDFASESWNGFSPELWSDMREQAQAAQTPALEERIIGRDIDSKALRAARDNAQRASVADDIHFEVGDVTNMTSKRRFGCLITNPPYGQRIGERRELDELYRKLPIALRGLPTWSHYVLTAYPAFERTVGRKADRRRKLYNGRIECTYFQFHGPKPYVEKTEAQTDTQPESQTAQSEQAKNKPFVHAVGKAAFGELDERAHEQATLFQARLRKRARHLRRWPTRRGITCFRIYDRDIPEIPLVVDRYEDYLHITEYRADKTNPRHPAEHASWLELMSKTASETLDIPSSSVFLKARERQRGKSQHEKLSTAKHEIIVNEGGLKLLVNLSDYVDAGLFLDHRETRQMVRELADGKDFLNLFCYTGSFTVYAAAGGAASTTSVDLSKNYLQWAQRNLDLNGLSGDQHRYIANDIREFIAKHKPGEQYDLVMLDPPTFSNSKRTEDDWNVQTDCVPLINSLLPLVRPGGLVFFSNNFRKFKLETDQIDASEVHEISRQTVPEDFRNKKIHRCWRIVK